MFKRRKASSNLKTKRLKYIAILECEKDLDKLKNLMDEDSDEDLDLNKNNDEDIDRDQDDDEQDLNVQQDIDDSESVAEHKVSHTSPSISLPPHNSSDNEVLSKVLLAKLCKTVNSLHNKISTISQNQLKLYRKLDKVLEKLNSPHDMTQEQESIAEVQTSPKVQEDFPICSIQDMTRLDQQLEDPNYRTDMMRYFSKFGGESIKSCTKTLLPKLMTDDVGKKYSWLGWQKKLVFQNLRLAQVIFETVRVHFPEATDSEISSHIKLWLVRAKERKERAQLKVTRKQILKEDMEGS